MTVKKKVGMEEIFFTFFEKNLQIMKKLGEERRLLMFKEGLRHFKVGTERRVKGTISDVRHIKGFCDG